MPRYFFHRTDGFVENDTDGIELRGLSEARLHAIVYAGETLQDDPERVWGGQEMYVEVTDENRELLFTVKIECFTTARRIANHLDGRPR